MTSSRRQITITRNQANYLTELLIDDLETTTLTEEEESGARSLLRRLQAAWADKEDV